MPKRKAATPRLVDKSAFKKKLEEIRLRLMGNPTEKELQGMQLQMDVMDQCARFAADGHDHDHSSDHDHAMLPPIVLAPSDTAKLQKPRKSRA